MKQVTIAVVLLGLALAAGLAVTRGLDGTGAAILLLLVVVGGLAVVVASKAGRGVVAPAQCPQCDGLVSPNAPYCKHCGAGLQPKG